MPQSLLGILVVLFTIAPVPASAQAGGTAPAAATDVTSAQGSSCPGEGEPGAAFGPFGQRSHH